MDVRRLVVEAVLPEHWTAWAKLAKCSPDIALRDIDDLVKRGILRKDAAGGRSTSYSLVE